MVEGKLSVSTQRGFSKVYSHCDLHQKNQKSQKLSIFEIRDEFGRTQNRKSTVVCTDRTWLDLAWLCILNNHR